MILSLCLWFRYFIHVNSVEASASLLPRGWKTVFEALFQFRPWPKCSFRRFSFFGHGGNAVFAVFTHPPWRKADFQRFLSVVPLRNAVFRIFYSSYPCERLFFGVFRISSTDDGRFSAFFGSPRGWKHIFRRFLHFWGLGKPFFPVFHSSEVSDDHFFQFLPQSPIET